MNAKIKKLKEQLKDWKEKAKAKEDRAKNTQLQIEIDKLKKQISELHPKDSALIVRLKADSVANNEKINKLKLFRENFLESKIVAYRSYIDKPFSNIVLEDLLSIKSELLVFKGDSTIDTFVVDLDKCIGLKEEVMEYNDVLKKRFDRGAINKSRIGIEAVKERMNQAQWNELYDTTDAYLSRYYYGTKLFQEIITKINNDFKVYRTGGSLSMKSSCIKLVEGILNKNNDDIEKLIMHIPYLAERFEIYKKQMLDNPLVRMEELEDEILSIEIDK